MMTSCLGAAAAAPAPDGPPVPAGYWDEAAVDAILSRTLVVRLDPDLAGLTPGEREAVEHLLEAGKIFQRLYEDQQHHQAATAHQALEQLDARLGSPERTRKLLDLYRLSKGPVTTTLENERLAFLPVAAEVPGKNVYPTDLEREEMDRYLEAYPGEREELLRGRWVVRRATAGSLRRDLAALQRHPVLDALHPGLRRRLESLARSPSRDRLYGLPASVAWADDVVRIVNHLNLAAGAVEKDDPDLARYLRHRGRDLLADDYDAGDAAWVTGRFGSLNAQIGAYETYDDELYGVKAFFSLSVLRLDRDRSEALREAVRGLQEIEDLLPYGARKRVREEIPIGVYDVVADFGQSRSQNTATILPNESHLARQYGRTILLRANIMRDPDIFEMSASAFRSAVVAEQGDHVTPEGNLQRTLWHEIGHYLGVDRTKDGRELDAELQDTSDLFEEMKADLVSLFAVEHLKKKGYYDEAGARSVYAGGIRRVLQKNRPRREQPYQTMQLMQWNFFLDRGVLAFDPAAGALRIDYARYPEAVRALLAEVLAIQHAGDRERAEEFVRRWTSWDDAVHGAIASKMRATERHRFVDVRYSALGE